MPIAALSSFSSMLSFRQTTSAPAANGDTSATKTAQSTTATKTSSPTKIDREMSQLLESLASNDPYTAKINVATLQKETKVDTGSGASSSPLDKLLGKLSTSLANNSDTMDALTQLSSYLIQNGSSSGSRISLTA